MFIVNGRIGHDKNIGKFTCRGASVVDYCMASPTFLQLIEDFEVSEHSKLYSDVYTPFTFGIKN